MKESGSSEMTGSPDISINFSTCRTLKVARSWPTIIKPLPVKESVLDLTTSSFTL